MYDAVKCKPNSEQDFETQISLDQDNSKTVVNKYTCGR